MDTFIGRAQAGFSKFSTAVGYASVLVAVLGYLQLWYSGAFDLGSTLGPVEPKMRWHDSWRFGAAGNHRKENARFTFDLEADLAPLFNWNTKQVFAYVTADYNTTNSVGVQNSNSVVVWDSIITDKDKATLSLTGQRSKYSVWGLKSEFGGDNREVQFNLRWNVQPRVGFLVNGVTEISGGRVQLPPLKKKESS